MIFEHEIYIGTIKIIKTFVLRINFKTFLQFGKKMLILFLKESFKFYVIISLYSYLFYIGT